MASKLDCRSAQGVYVQGVMSKAFMSKPISKASMSRLETCDEDLGSSDMLPAIRVGYGCLAESASSQYGADPR